MDDRYATRGISRRTFLLAGASAAGLGVTGCCTLPPTTVPGICAPPPPAYLASKEVLNAWAKPQRYFDAHTHIFNGQDVPVAGFLTKSFGHSAGPLQGIIAMLGPLVEKYAQSIAITARAEMDKLCGRTTADFSIPGGADSLLDGEIYDRQRELSDGLFERVQRQPELFREIESILSEARRQLASSEDSQIFIFNKDFIHSAFQDGATPTRKLASGLSPEALMRPAVQIALKLRGIFQFIGNMLAYRHHNLRNFIRGYNQGSPDVPLSGCFTAIVDFGYWLGCPDHASNMQDQVLLHEQISLLSRGFMLPLVGYNPWVDINDQNASLDLVERAITRHGCVGVKIYPPMGFYPWGNMANPLSKDDERRPDPKDLDDRLMALYELCAGLKVPVMAHANQSMGRNTIEDDLGDYRGWKWLDDERNKREKTKLLNVNLGHFGGALAHNNVDWAEQFIERMRESKTMTIYGDLGHWEELADNDHARLRLIKLLKESIGNGQTAADRVMYGTDWHMLSKVPGWESYASMIAGILKEVDSTGAVRAKVLGSNVLDFYGLSEKTRGLNSQRVINHFKDHLNSKPGWM